MPKGPFDYKTWKPVRAIIVDAKGDPQYTHPRVWSKHLDTVGDGTGLHNAVGNYADAGLGAEEFMITSANDGVEVNRLLITVEAASGFKAEIYGSGSALTNGIDLEWRNAQGGVIEIFTDKHSVKTNSHWAMYCFDVDVKSWRTSGSGNELLTARWTFTRMGHSLHLDAGESLVMKLNDDFSVLVLHHFVVQGIGKVRA